MVWIKIRLDKNTIGSSSFLPPWQKYSGNERVGLNLYRMWKRREWVASAARNLHSEPKKLIKLPQAALTKNAHVPSTRKAEQQTIHSIISSVRCDMHCDTSICMRWCEAQDLLITNKCCPYVHVSKLAAQILSVREPQTVQVQCSSSPVHDDANESWNSTKKVRCTAPVIKLFRLTVKDPFQGRCTRVMGNQHKHTAQLPAYCVSWVHRTLKSRSKKKKKKNKHLDSDNWRWQFTGQLDIDKAILQQRKVEFSDRKLE